MESTNNHECLVSTLMKLRESSKDAVVSADYIDDFALYMHVGRPVQERFEDQLKKSAESSHAELILLCGSVGDGKSHMLQMCKHKFKDYMDRFYVHNDSTASLYIDKPATYTLNELLEDFSDEKVDKSTSKVILAINLGTLSNFLDQDVEGRFTRLSIISTRTLLNFIYEILVNENYFDQGSLEPRKIPDKLTQIQYINSLLPSTLFDREGSSELLTAIHKVDPLHIRNEKIDEFFVHYENDDQALSVFYQDLPAYKDVLTKIQDADFSDYANHDLKDELLHLYIRMCRLLMIKEDLLPEDKLYVEYMRFLYAWNIGNQQDLRQLYNDVEKGILS